jgi:hypothetical protein
MKSSILLFLAPLIFFLFFAGCKDNPVDPPPSEEVPKNLFPLVPGRVIVFGEGYLTHEATDSMIAGTNTTFSSQWIIAGPSTVIPHPSLPVTVVLDTTSVTAMNLVRGRTFFIAQDTATGNFDFLTNLGLFYRDYKITAVAGDTTSSIRADSLKWITLAKASEGLNKTWNAFDETFTGIYTGQTVQITLVIEARFEAKETITAGGVSYESYRLNATRKAYLGGNLVSTGITAVIWLVPDVGPIQMFLAGDAEAPGKWMKMTAKNF